MNALQTLSKAQLLQQLGRSGRTDCGIHITMMSHDQYVSQVRSADPAQLEVLLWQEGPLQDFHSVSSTSIGADARKGANVPAWNIGHEGSN